jgi:hypothetical protein
MFGSCRFVSRYLPLSLSLLLYASVPTDYDNRSRLRNQVYSKHVLSSKSDKNYPQACIELVKDLTSRGPFSTPWALTR